MQATVLGVLIGAVSVAGLPLAASASVIAAQRNDTVQVGQTHFATDLFNAHDPLGGSWSPFLYSTTSGAFSAGYLTGVAFEPYDSRGNPDTYLLQLGTYSDLACNVPLQSFQSSWILPATTSSRMVTVNLPATSTPLGGVHCIKWGAYGQANTFPQIFANSQYGSYGNGEYPYFELLGDGAAPQGPLATTTPPACTQDCNDNVLFIPGIEASRLYAPQVVGNPERKLWEPLSGDDVHQLFMSNIGTSLRNDIYAKPGDVIDELPVTGKKIYKSFIALMDELKSPAQSKINDWEAVPYDWRLQLDEIINTGALRDGKVYYGGTQGATSTPYIIQELRRLAATSRSKKVTIVAHSNGGLVAKELTAILGSEAPTLINRMILVDVPQTGTPAALAAALHGHEQELVYGLILDAATARSFASTSPMVYNLLPSNSYFGHVSDPVVTFDPSLPDWSARYGTSITTSQGLRDFITDTYGRVDSQAGDVEQPIQLSRNLYDASQGFHAVLDNWTPPAGVALVQIAGWGIPKTVSGITYKKKGSGVTYEANLTEDGDGTVVIPSELWTSTTTGSLSNYWVNLASYNRIIHRLPNGNIFKIDHANILDATPVLDLLHDSLLGQPRSPEQYGYLSVEQLVGTGKRLRYSLHSPLNLDLYDNNGLHTGVSSTTGEVEEQIPGTYYAQFGDVKYLFTDATTPLHIYMRGYDSGTFTFKTEELAGDTVTASTTWQDMPVTPDTVVSLDTASDILTQSHLRIDKDDNGSIDYDLAPVLNAVVTLPKPKLTVSARDASLIVGAPMPPLDYSLSGFIGPDTATSSDVTGSATCSAAATSTNHVGSFSISCAKGTLSSNVYEFGPYATGTLRVGYRWGGFSQPINDVGYNPGQAASVFKAGSTVPVKFQIKNASGAAVQAGIAPLWLTPQKGSPMSALVDEATYSDPGTIGTVYKYDVTSQQYIYNWSTKGLSSGYWYRIFAKLDDGNVYSVTVGLK